MAQIGTNDWQSIAYGNGKYVVVGLGGKAAYSTDGLNWTIVTVRTNLNMYSIAFGNGKFVALGNESSTGKIYYSTDGIIWTLAMQASVGSYSNYLHVIFDGSKFVACGGNRACYNSIDGITWQTSSFPFLGVNGLAYGGGKYIAFDNSTAGNNASSTDGTTWTTQTPLGRSCSDMTYGNGKFVLCGRSLDQHEAWIIYSENGINWSAPIIFDEKYFYGITFGNGKFVVVGASGVCAHSIDGINWSTPVQLKDENGSLITTQLNDIIIM